MNRVISKAKVRKTRQEPQRTRKAILEVAGKLLAKVGPEGLSVSQVAQSANVDRGTVYHHFPKRDDLLSATRAWMSEKLCHEVFGEDPGRNGEWKRHNPREVIENLVNFAMENPEFGRVWVNDVLGSSELTEDPFWNVYRGHVTSFVESEFAQPDIDGDVHTVMMLVTAFMWPVWARAHARNAAARRKMAKRFADELQRLSFHGLLRKEKFSEFDDLLRVNGNAHEGPKKKAKKGRSKLPLSSNNDDVSINSSDAARLLRAMAKWLEDSDSQ